MAAKNMWKRPWICGAYKAESAHCQWSPCADTEELSLPWLGQWSTAFGRNLLTKGLQPSTTVIGYTDCVLKKWLFHLFLTFVVFMFIPYSFGAQQGCKNIMCGSPVPETNRSRGKKEKSQLLVWQSFGKVGSTMHHWFWERNRQVSDVK